MRTSLFIFCAIAVAGCSRGTVGSLPLAPSGANDGGSSSSAAQHFDQRLASYRAAPDTYASVYSFKSSPDGANPVKSLVNVGGELYGTTAVGGTGTECRSHFGCGTVFKVSPSGDESVVHSFKDYPDGALPQAGLTDLDGELYGTTDSGGNKRHCGTVFKISPSGEESVIHVFPGSPDGRNPEGSLIKVNGELYGTTEYGGHRGCRGGCGTVFAISPSGDEHVVYSFKSAPDGNYPMGSLTNVNGELYGTAVSGGTSGKGAVFVVDSSGIEHIVYSFKRAPDGSTPEGGVIAVNGELYGTTALGGSKSSGTVFKLSPSGKESVLYSFGSRSYPQGGLINVNGELYGTTVSGGGGFPGSGIVFKISLSGQESVVYHFKGGTDGKNPYGGLINVNGALYGTTQWGGTSHFGTIFSVSP
jgi:uncharacterized repeat protein (TIGR03803 family)